LETPVDILLKPMIVEDVVIEVPDVPSKRSEVQPSKRSEVQPAQPAVDEDPILVIKLKWS
jgi:hypothetical protein